MPLSVLTGTADIMRLCEHDVFFFTTFGGEALSLAAAKTTIEEMIERNVPQELERKGRFLQDSLNQIFFLRESTFLKCIGAPCRTMLAISATSLGTPLEVKTYFQQEFLRYGILWSGFHTMSYSHSEEDIDHLIRAYGEILPKLEDMLLKNKKVKEYLIGKSLAPVFRRTENFHTKPKMDV
jgi:glutamate-1-semialdehyde aminotransferase